MHKLVGVFVGDLNRRNHCKGVNLSCIKDAVVQCFRSPKRVGIVKFQEINTFAGIGVRADVNFHLAFTAVHRNYT